MSRCTLQLGEQVVLVANGGTPEVEYALFDPGDLELQATDPGTIREIGYRTTVSEARVRLAGHGVTAALADEAAIATRPAVARAYARGPAVRCIVDRLEAAELFEGNTFDPTTGLYAGTWLDLPALSVDVGVPGAHALLQAMHLAALLAERAAHEPVALATSEVTTLRRPGERTYRRVTLPSPPALVQALRSLKPRSDRADSSAGPGRQEIVERLRERARLTPASRDRLASLEGVLMAVPVPVRGPLADAELWSIEAKLSEGDVATALGLLEAVERQRGRLPATAYLRARAALLGHSEDPFALAERVSSLSTSMSSFHELELLAAQAWAAAGEGRRARAFARDLVDNASVSDSIRMQALDVIAAASSPPSSADTAAAHGEDAASPSSPRLFAQGPPIAKPSQSQSRSDRTASASGAPSRPPYRIEHQSERFRAAPAAPAGAIELLEKLSPPDGLPSLPPAPGPIVPGTSELPRTPTAARAMFTRLTRELGAELSTRHGVEVQSDVNGLELAQRYLHESPGGERAVMQHGAFLSELLARHLNARWVDLDSDKPEHWSMLIPSKSHTDEVVRVWPFARVLRFILMGHKERDLVSYYLELETRTR